MKLALYRFATIAGLPLIRAYLARRRVRGREDRARFSERLGVPSLPRPAGPLVWMHGASVGEALSMLPVIGWMREHRSDLNILVTTGTVTSATLLAERLPAGAVHQYIPVDRPAWVRRFLQHWRPDRALWFESELWPNLLLECRRSGVPMALVNGRMSGRSFEKWQRHPNVVRELLGCFDICLGQTETDADRFRQLGAANTASFGNLKLAADPLPADDAAVAALSAAIAGRPCWLASSTHAGEERIAGRVHRELAARHPGLLTIVVPRHPDRGAAIVAELAKQGLRVARRGVDEALPGATDDIYVADTVGELGLFYRLADIVFIGKSMTLEGGQNPIEPARFAKPVLFGPNMQNFEELSARMLEAGAACRVADEAGLVAKLGALLTDADEAAAQGARARSFAEAEASVLDAVMDALVGRLPERSWVDTRVVAS
ncbi:MAG: 3-deoxy-D-manno-octulosonic acid transferase [Rhodospirillales bacterium]